jgi:nucleoside triphosphatase
MVEQQYPEPTVGPLIFNKEGKLFLMQSPKWHNLWVIPGGHIELGETMHQALKREVKEETGLEIYDVKYLCTLEFIFDPVFVKKKHFIFINFSAKTDSTDVRLNHEGSAYKWVTIEEAEKMDDLEPYTRKVIEVCKKKK